VDGGSGAAAIVLAGGSGTRVGGDRNKVHLRLAGRPVVEWSVEAFRGAPGVGPVVLVVREADRELLGHLPGVEVVAGGATRQASELAGLRHLAPRIADGSVDAVLVHDAARPLVTRALVAAVLRAARRDGGAVPGLLRDDLALAGPGGTLGAAAPGLVAVQTPQGFRARELLAAYEAAAGDGFAGTDTASCVARYAPGLTVRWVPGDPANTKITYPRDLAPAEAALRERG
jgi:2-C-methyl-D-erythritol 4-phosphate cytidylyltransferase